MGKIVCCICGNELGFFASKVTLKDGFVCNKCMKKANMREIPSSLNVPKAQVIQFIPARQEALSRFSVTKDFGRIQIDTNSRSFMIDDELYLFDNLVSFRFHEDPDNSKIAVNNGKSGGAAIGGIIGGLGGGLVGSAVGAAVGNKVGSLFSSVCNYMYINILLKDAFITDVRLEFIEEKTRISSKAYTEALREAQECLDALAVIKEYCNREDSRVEPLNNVRLNLNSVTNNNMYIQDSHMSAVQIADELKVFKELADKGLITNEEYEEKKKQLLSMK